MKIAVVMRLVPNLIEGVELNEDQSDIDREWTDTQANETDEQALEEALVLKETLGASVCAVGLSDEGVDRLLRSAVAKGADAAVELDLNAEMAQALPSITTAAPLAGWLGERQFDLVLVGNQKVDDPFGGLAGHLAAALNVPVIAGVTQIAKDAESGLRALQEYGEGKSAWIGFSGPAVIGVQTASRPIRYVSGSKLREAMSSSAFEKADIGVAETAAPQIRLSLPAKREGGDLIDDPAEGVAKLLAILEQRNLI